MDAITELIALIEEFGTSVLRFPTLAGIAVTAAVFALEIKWSRAHAPGGRRVEKAVRLGHVVEARRTTYWDDATTPAERPTSWYHALYTYDISGRQYRYTYLERAYPPPPSGCIISTIRAGLSATNGSGAPRPTSCSCSSRSQPERASCACCTDARRADSAKTKRGSSQIQKPHFLFCGQPPGIALRIVVDAISFAVAFSLCMQALLSVARSLFFPRKGPA